MEMNPTAEIYTKMPPYILLLLKSTEPYLDQYFSLALHRASSNSGVGRLTETQNSSKHRVTIAK